MRACAPGAGHVAANAEKLPWTETDGRAQEEVGGSGSKNKALAATAAQTATRGAAKRVRDSGRRRGRPGLARRQFSSGLVSRIRRIRLNSRSVRPNDTCSVHTCRQVWPRVPVSDESCLLDHVGTLSSVRNLTPLPPGGPSVMRRIRRPSTERRHPAVALSTQSGLQKSTLYAQLKCTGAFSLLDGNFFWKRCTFDKFGHALTG